MLSVFYFSSPQQTVGRRPLETTRLQSTGGWAAVSVCVCAHHQINIHALAPTSSRTHTRKNESQTGRARDFTDNSLMRPIRVREAQNKIYNRVRGSVIDDDRNADGLEREKVFTLEHFLNYTL